MSNRTDLMDKLSRNIRRLEKKVEHRKIYNIRNFVVRSLLKSGIAIDYALPFILATIVIAHSFVAKGNLPFHIDEIKEKAKVETIDTSNGIHLEHVSYDFSYDDKLIEYSTGWVINDRGLYRRVVTSYRISDEIDLSETDKILSMSREELENILVITNVQTIYKNTLTQEDMLYDSDAIIVVNHTESETETITRQETIGENVLWSIWFIILSLGWGNSLRSIKKIFMKTYIRDKLLECHHLFRQISKEELETIEKVLAVKKQNLAMLDETAHDVGESGDYLYRLRRDNSVESEGGQCMSQMDTSMENEGRQYVLRRARV